MSCTKCGSGLRRPRLEVVCCSGPGVSDTGERCGLKYLPSCAKKLQSALNNQLGGPASSGELALNECFHCTASPRFLCPCKGGHGKLHCTAYAKRQRSASRGAHEAQQQLGLQSLPPAILQLTLKDLGLHSNVAAMLVLINPMITVPPKHLDQALSTATNAGSCFLPMSQQQPQQPQQPQQRLLLQQPPPQGQLPAAAGRNLSCCSPHFITSACVFDPAGGCTVQPAAAEAAAGEAVYQAHSQSQQQHQPVAMDTDSSPPAETITPGSQQQQQQQLCDAQQSAAAAAAAVPGHCRSSQIMSATAERQYSDDVMHVGSAAADQQQQVSQQWQQQRAAEEAGSAVQAAAAALRGAPGVDDRQQQQQPCTDGIAWLPPQMSDYENLLMLSVGTLEQQDLCGDGLLRPPLGTVNFTATCAELSGEDALDSAAMFLQELLQLDCADDLAVGEGCNKAVAAVGHLGSFPLGKHCTPAAEAAATAAAYEAPSSSSSCSSNSPLQLCHWLWDCADAAAEGQFTSTASATAAVLAGSSSTNPHSNCSSSSSRTNPNSSITVLSAATGGGVVAYCQHDWGVYLPPAAADAPALHSLSTYVLPVSSTCVPLLLQGINLAAEQQIVLVKQGSHLHTLPVLPAAAAATMHSTTPTCCSVVLPSTLLQKPCLLLLSVAAGQHYVSDSQALLVLPVTSVVAQQLNEMVQGSVGLPLLSWLHMLLLQPDQKLQRQLAANMASSSSSWGSSTGSSSSRESEGLAAYDTYTCSAPSVSPMQAAAPAVVNPAADPCAEPLLPLRVASLRALAAYNLLAVSISEQKLDVVQWLLQTLAAESSQTTAAAVAPGQGAPGAQQQQQVQFPAPTVQQALVAQQRLAWCGTVIGQQVPVLLLAGSTGSTYLVQLLQQWSANHGLPAGWSCSWRGASLQQILNHHQQQQQQQQPGGCSSPRSCQQALTELQAAVQPLLQQLWQQQKSRVAAAAAGGNAESVNEWSNLGLDIANMVKADSLQQLEAVLGPAGDLPAAVAAGNYDALQHLLATAHAHPTTLPQQWQQQLDTALEFAALLGHSRLPMAKLLLLHGANPYSKDCVALAWAARRSKTAGETAMQLLLCEHAAACNLGSSTTGSTTTSASTNTTNISSSSSSMLAVAAWCLGMQHELSGLHRPGCQARLQSLQQWLASCPVQQRTVGNLIDALGVDCGQRGCGMFLDAEEIDAVARGQRTREAIASSGSCRRGQVIKPQPSPGEWQFLQCFGERQVGEEVQEADVISAVAFDAEGSFLATGDRGGRVVLFAKVPSQPRHAGPDQRQPISWGPGFEFRYLTEFQSHEPEFDYLKSLEIEEGINQVKWVHSNTGGSQHILSTNDKTLKLWKVQERKLQVVTGWNLERPGQMQQAARAGVRAVVPCLNVGRLRLPMVVSHESRPVSRAKRIYANAHTYHINSIAVNSDQQTFLSADDLRINLWSLDVPNRCFNMLDIKPDDMARLSEVITCADFHPQHCHMFAYSSSKGCIRLGDMRSAALCDRHVKAFDESDPSGGRCYFSEIIASISSLRFSPCGRYLLSRDYMNLKLWDLNMEDRPIMTLQVQEEVRPRLGDLYENDCIFDKFGCSLNGPATCFVSGTYNNAFKVFDCNSAMSSHQQALPWCNAPAATVLEATRDPMRKYLQLAPGATPPNQELDCSNKLLHMAWHPEANVIACAAANSLYMYCA